MWTRIKNNVLNSVRRTRIISMMHYLTHSPTIQAGVGTMAIELIVNCIIGKSLGLSVRKSVGPLYTIKASTYSILKAGVTRNLDTDAKFGILAMIWHNGVSPFIFKAILRNRPPVDAN